MRKLKLQVQMSIDGFIAGPGGEMDWMEWNWDDALKAYVSEITEPVDCILLGHNLAKGFIPYWETAEANNEEGAEKLNKAPKIVFSRSLTVNPWKNTRVENGDLATTVTALKQEQGGDLITYGGADFVASLIEADLIDEYNLFVNPTAMGSGMTIFRGRKNLKLVSATSFNCGIVAYRYEPLKG